MKKKINSQYKTKKTQLNRNLREVVEIDKF